MKFTYKKFVALACAVVFMLGCMSGCSFRQYDDEPHVFEADDTMRTPKFNLPYTPEGSRTEIRSIFTSSVDNPDNGFVHGDRVATIIVRNRAMHFMNYAYIQIRLFDDSLYEFQVYNVPTERDIIAFEINGKELPEEPLIKLINVENVFTENVPSLGKQLSYELDGTDVTITNQTRKPMTIGVSFHTLSDDGVTLLGGMSYYQRLSLDAEETQQFTVEDAAGMPIELMTTEEIG